MSSMSSLVLGVALLFFFPGKSFCDNDNQKGGSLLFQVFPGKVLNPSGAKGQTVEVVDSMSCILECKHMLWCRSVNFATTARDNGRHVCELLSVDQFSTRKGSMQLSKLYDYYSLQVSHVFSTYLFSNHL